MEDEQLLSAGAITQILEDHKPANPVLQIIGYKPMTPDQMAFGSVSDELRYRLMIGDGIKAHQYCVITNQELVEDIKNGKLEKWSIIKVTSYQTVDYGEGAPDQKRRLIYILNLELVKRGSEVGRKLVVTQTDNKMPVSTNNHQQHQPPTPNYQSNRPYDQQPLQQQQHQPPQQQQQGYNSRPMGPGSGMNNPGIGGYQSTQAQPYPGLRNDMMGSPRVMRNSHDQQTIGIGELTPYIGKWVVKGRCTGKSALREYTNAKGAGKLFNFTLADKTGEVKITGFNADCERFYAYIEPNKVYLLGRATVKAADKRYTTADFEITLNNDSLLEEIVDSKEVEDIPLAKFNFTSIASLPNLPPNQPCDLIGAIIQISDMTTVVSRTKNKELKKRNITIVDMSRHSIGVTIWGDASETFAGVVGDVFVTRAARIGTYGGRSASAGDVLFINPDIPEMRKLKNWYSNLLDSNFTSLTASADGQGGGDQFHDLEEMSKLDKVRQIVSTGQNSGLYFKTKAILLAIGKNPVYKCCPTDNCGKKLVDTPNGELKCDKCQQTYSHYKYRYKTDIEISDRTTASWVTLWDEKAESILGMKPDELAKYMKMENKDAYEKIITKANFNFYTFTLRSRIDTYNQEERVKLNVINLAPLDVDAFGKRLIDEIKKIAST